MEARSSSDAHSWSNRIPSSAGDIQGGCFLRRVPLPLPSSLLLSSSRLFPTWQALAAVELLSSPCVFDHGYAVARIGEPLSGRPARYDGPPIPITTRPFVYFAALRVTDLTVMPLCTAPGFPLPDYTSCAIGIIRRGLLRRFYPAVPLRLNQLDARNIMIPI